MTNKPEQLPEWRKSLNEAVENYQSTRAWYEENQDSPSAEQDMDAAAGEIEKLIKQYGVLIVLNLLDEIDELQEHRKPVITFYSEGIAAAANWVDQQRESYDNEHGRRDNDTGSFEFGNDAQRDYSDTLAEIAEGIRALHPSTSEQERRKADGTESVSFDELNAAVAEVTGCNQHAWNANIYKGHQAVPFMNFNSLARIVDKYRAPQPAPVVPEEKRDEDGNTTSEFDHGWNACRAAMLQAGNSPVTPDGWIPVSERMPDKLIPVMVMYEDGEMWSAMWNGNSWDDGTEYPDPHEVTHWREMPAAPQQEVK